MEGEPHPQDQTKSGETVRREGTISSRLQHQERKKKREVSLGTIEEGDAKLGRAEQKRGKKTFCGLESIREK